MDKITQRIKALNLVRSVFKIRLFERTLATLTEGKSPDHFLSSLAPNPYQYSTGSFRRFRRNGIEMNVDISDYVGHYLYFGFVEKGFVTLFRNCKPGDTILDIGTNIGWVAQNMAAISATGSVIGFEPDPLNFQRCSDNLALNNFKNLTVLPIGIGSVNDSARMEVRTTSNLAGNRIAPAGATSTTEVKIMRLDDVEEVQKLSTIDLIKIDVEGYEIHVLRGAAGTLNRHHPVLFIELDDNNLKDQGDSAQGLVKFLLEVGYRKIENVETGEGVTLATDFTDAHFDIIVK
jgi:FkbM family methyltransferase